MLIPFNFLNDFLRVVLRLLCVKQYLDKNPLVLDTISEIEVHFQALLNEHIYSSRYETNHGHAASHTVVIRFDQMILSSTLRGFYARSDHDAEARNLDGRPPLIDCVHLPWSVSLSSLCASFVLQTLYCSTFLVTCLLASPLVVYARLFVHLEDYYFSHYNSSSLPLPKISLYQNSERICHSSKLQSTRVLGACFTEESLRLLGTFSISFVNRCFRVQHYGRTNPHERVQDAVEGEVGQCRGWHANSHIRSQHTNSRVAKP